MLSPAAYFIVLLLVSIYAFVAGRSDERFAAVVCILASIASVVVMSPLTGRYSGVEVGVLVVDLLALAGFTILALRSDRFWPLWVAGLQLTTLVAHGLKAIELDLMPHAYAAAARFWVYPIFLIIVVGTYRHHKRMRQSEALAP